jgi:sarcosine oxidase
MSSASGQSLHGSAQFLETTIAAAEKFGITHRVLDAGEIAAEFPQFMLDGSERGYFEDEAGFLRPELGVTTQLSVAEKLGADLRLNERVLRVEKDGAGIRVTTDNGSYLAATAIVSAGPWISELIPAASDMFKVYRQVLYWFDVSAAYEQYALGRFPIFIWSFGRFDGDFVYGFPAINGRDGGLKVASEEFHVTTSPDEADRSVTDEETARVHSNYVAGKLAGVGERCVRAAVCLYTSTPDSNFVIDWMDENVLLASPCSGHGFKHSAAIGETLAELALTRTSKIDVSAFKLVARR